MKFVKLFCSVYVTLILLALYGILCAVATFIEADASYGTHAAQDLIYKTAFFNIVHFLLLLNLVGVFIYKKIWKSKKYYSIILHISFIVILIGAAITRFYGFEGVMHIREGESANTIATLDEYLNIRAEVNDKIYYTNIPVRYNPVTQTKFHEQIPLEDSVFEVKYNSYKEGSSFRPATINVTVNYGGESKTMDLPQSFLDADLGEVFELGGKRFQLVWGPAPLSVPFEIHLDDFILTRYPGSKSPSSYKSVIKVTDYEDNSSFSYEIFMNNVLDYKGYRFFQSSYDQDEHGTILSVNKDPGKIPTYIGYFLLTVGFVWSFFGTYGRIWRLGKYVKKQNLYVLLIAFSSLLFAGAGDLYAKENIVSDKEIIEYAYADMSGKEDNSTAQHGNALPVISQEELQKFMDNVSSRMGPHSEKAGKLLVQDIQGRIKPLDTLAMDMMHKLFRKDEFNGMNYMEVFLGMMMYYDYFQQIKMFPTGTEELRVLLGTPVNEKYVSFSDVYDDKGAYKLQDAVEKANLVNPASRNKFEKDLLKFDEKIGLAYYLYTAQMFVVFPDITGKTTGFLSPGIAMATFDKENTLKVQDMLQNYFLGIDKGLNENNWEDADKYLGLISEFQRTHGEKLIPSDGKIFVEILMNKYNPFKNLTLVYVLLGIILFGFVLAAILKNKPVNKTAGRILFILSIIAVVFHTLGLICRWYIAGYAPWSNAYESMIYIAWAGAAAGLIFFRKSLLAVSATNFVAGITLFVANLGFMDPQIGTLVPVLKSYWLNIHVSVITASYSFFGLSFVLGIVGLLLFVLRSDKRKHIDQSIVNINAINEISLILGLGLLTIGTFLGGVWANESWGRYWGWDPKETWSLITIIVYTMIIHARLVPSLNKPYIFTVISTLGFYAVLMTYFGVNYYLSGKHSYASGEPVPVPTFLYVMVLCHILLIAVAFFKRNINKENIEEI